MSSGSDARNHKITSSGGGSYNHATGGIRDMATRWCMRFSNKKCTRIYYNDPTIVCKLSILERVNDLTCISLNSEKTVDVNIFEMQSVVPEAIDGVKDGTEHWCYYEY